MKRKIEVTEADLWDGCGGFCRDCGADAYDCEPDADNYECEVCGARAVAGLEVLLIEGRLELVG